MCLFLSLDGIAWTDFLFLQTFISVIVGWKRYGQLAESLDDFTRHTILLCEHLHPRSGSFHVILHLGRKSDQRCIAKCRENMATGLRGCLMSVPSFSTITFNSTAIVFAWWKENAQRYSESAFAHVLLEEANRDSFGQAPKSFDSSNRIHAELRSIIEIQGIAQR